MTKSSRKGEQAAQELVELVPVHKWSECKSKDDADSKSKLDAFAETDSEPRSRVEAIHTKQEDKVCRCQVQVDVLEAKQNGERDAAGQEP